MVGRELHFQSPNGEDHPGLLWDLTVVMQAEGGDFGSPVIRNTVKTKMREEWLWTLRVIRGNERHLLWETSCTLLVTIWLAHDALVMTTKRTAKVMDTSKKTIITSLREDGTKHT